MSQNVPPELDILTPREQRIFLLLANGKTAKEIGFTLGISINTVRTHVKHIKRKLNMQRVGWANQYKTTNAYTDNNQNHSIYP